MDTGYCYEKCKIGRAASEVLLELNNSVFEASNTFNTFVKNCSNTCPYMHLHASTHKIVKLSDLEELLDV